MTHVYITNYVAHVYITMSDERSRGGEHRAVLAWSLSLSPTPMLQSPNQWCAYGRTSAKAVSHSHTSALGTLMHDLASCFFAMPIVFCQALIGSVHGTLEIKSNPDVDKIGQHQSWVASCSKPGKKLFKVTRSETRTPIYGGTKKLVVDFSLPARFACRRKR